MGTESVVLIPTQKHFEERTTGTASVEGGGRRLQVGNRRYDEVASRD